MPLRILVVDDDRDILRIYASTLRRRIKPKDWDYSLPEKSKSLFKVEMAESVSLALKKMKKEQFEILVVDLKIPGLTGDQMGGLELINESIKLDKLRPIIVITGFGSIELARKTFTQGVFDFIEKSDKAVDDLIQAVQKAIDARNEKLRRWGNPFTRMTNVDPTVFGGRTRELEFFEQRLIRALNTKFCEHFLVHGNWGIGKSTLFKEYKKICQSRGHLASIVPLELLEPSTRQIEAAHSILEGILRDLPYSVDRFKKVTNFFNSIGISILGSGFQFSRDVSKKEYSPQALLHDTLFNLWQDLKDETEVFVIFLDDFDNFMSVSEILMTLKQTLSMDLIKNTKILFGISLTPACWCELTSIQKHHPLSRYFLSRIELAPLSEDELKETVVKSLADTGVTFDEDVIIKTYDCSQGNPFKMQILCYHLFNNQINRRVKIDVWEKALQAALKDMGTDIFEN